MKHKSLGNIQEEPFLSSDDDEQENIKQQE